MPSMQKTDFRDNSKMLHFQNALNFGNIVCLI